MTVRRGGMIDGLAGTPNHQSLHLPGFNAVIARGWNAMETPKQSVPNGRSLPWGTLLSPGAIARQQGSITGGAVSEPLI